MDRFPYRTGVVWGWLTAGVLMLPACSELTPSPPAASTFPVTFSATQWIVPAASTPQDQHRNASHSRTGSVALAGHMFPPPPLPLVDAESFAPTLDAHRSRYQDSIIRLAPDPNPSGMEPPPDHRHAGQQLPRRLPKTDPLDDDTVERLPPVEPGILPLNDEVTRIDTSVPDLETSPPDPLVRHLPPLPFDLAAETGQTNTNDPEEQEEPLPRITEVIIGESEEQIVPPLPQGPWAVVIPPPLPDQPQPLGVPSELTDRPTRLPGVDTEIPIAQAARAPGHGVRLAPPRDLDEAPDLLVVGRSVSEEPKSTWVALEQNVAAIIDRAEDLAARGAYFAARAEMIKALRLITQTLDANQGGREHSAALTRAMRALREVGDFAQSGSRLESELDVGETVRGHGTPVLKHENVDQMAPATAQQRYLEYAQQQLAVAGGHLPAASEALYVLARIYTVLDGTQLETHLLGFPQAVVLHQAALAVDPHNGRAANELGVLLVRCGQLEKAREVLSHSISVLPAPETWHNLSVVQQRMGQVELARYAAEQSATVAAQQNRQSLDVPVQSVQWVDPQTFSSVRSMPEP
ncbi:MAG: tetratricopeptide repeat protein [Pirellulaceae bacterium]